MSASEIVNKVPASPAGRWNYAHVLRDDLSACDAQADGVGYLPCRQAGGDYVEQITYLIFLKMADEREVAGVPSPQSSPKGRGGNGVPKEFDWAELVRLDGDDLEIQYRHSLESLGKQGGTCLPIRRRQVLGTIFRKALNKIENGFI